MDYVTRQFINLTKKFRREIPKLVESLRNDIKQHIDAAREARNAYEQGRNTAPVLRAELQVPHPIEVQTSSKDKKTGREWYKLIVETLTLLAVVAYAIVAIRQWREMIQARHQAQASIQVTKDSLLYVQRAFVAITTFDVTRLTAPGTNKLDGSMRLGFSWQNGGNTPTKDMTTHVSERLFSNPLPNGFDFPDYPNGSIPFAIFVGRQKIPAARLPFSFPPARFSLFNLTLGISISGDGRDIAMCFRILRST